MKLANVFRDSPNLIAVTRRADGRFVDVNPAFENVLGYTREEALGKTPIDLGIWEDPSVRADILKRLADEGTVSNEPVTFLTRDGRTYDGLITVELVVSEGEEFVFSLIQDVSAHNELKAAIRRAEESYRSIVENATEGIYQTTLDGQLLSANPALARMLGYETPAELMREVNDVGRQLYLNPEIRRRVTDRLLTQGQVADQEYQLVRRDGRRIWVSENARAVRDEHGSLLYFEGTLLDITERKRAEDALRQSEQRYRTLVDQCQDGVFVAQDGRYIYVNQAFAHMLGYSQREMIGMDYMQIVAPEDREAQIERRRRRLAGSRAPHAFEIHYLKRDGETRMLASVRNAAIDYNGRIASLGTVRDITEEKLRRQALEEAERKYRSIFRDSVTGMYRTSPEGRLLEANQALAEIFGYESPREMIEDIGNIIELYERPQDREEFVDKLVRTGRLRGHEYPLMRRDGRRIWVTQNARVVRADDGSVRFFEGTLMDVTERKHAEQARRRSEALYRSLVEQSHVGVFINEDGFYTYVNRAFASMLGYTEDELTGMSYREVVAPEDLADADERFRRRQHGEPAPVTHEVRMLHKDGHTRVIANLSVSVLDEEGKRRLHGTVVDITESKQFEWQLKHNATHDPLTGLSNRALFSQRLRRAMQRLKEEGSGYAVLFLDLDGFKVVNDSLGHAVGDKLLIEIARRLEDCVGEAGLIARHGGDEFTVLSENVHTEQHARELASKLLESLQQSFRIGRHELFTRASVGIVLGSERYHSTDTVLRDADTAMYEAKARGQNQCVVFDDSMHAAAKARLSLETELRLALEREEFEVHYQPLVDLRDGHVAGLEALVRWRHPVQGLLYPDEFLAVAEETGLVVAMDWWVMEAACRQLVAWQEADPQLSELTLHVNVDDRQFWQADMPDRLARVLDDTGIRRECLHLEITESVFREEVGQIRSILKRLSDLGVFLHVDDFGTGYSSLNSFSSLQFHGMKIDRAFVRDLESNKRHRAIVRTMLRLAADLDMQTVAEGVENATQARVLRRLGCRLAQGFHFARALPSEEIVSRLGRGQAVVEG